MHMTTVKVFRERRGRLLFYLTINVRVRVQQEHHWAATRVNVFDRIVSVTGATSAVDMLIPTASLHFFPYFRQRSKAYERHEQSNEIHHHVRVQLKLTRCTEG